MESFDFLSEERKLTAEEARLLVDKLLLCESIYDRNRRDIIVKQLNKSITQVITRHASDKFDAMNIVQTCLEHPGGLKELIKIVAFFEGNSLPIQRVKKLLQFIFLVPRPLTINQDLFGKFIEIIIEANVGRDDLIRIYKASMPIGRPLPEVQSSDEFEMFTLMIRELAQIDLQNTGTLPLLTFIKLLAKHTHEASVRDALEIWIKEEVRAAGVAELSISHLPETVPVALSPQTSFHLLIKFEPDRFAKKLGEVFFIRAWLLRKQRGKVDPEPVATKEEVYSLGAEPTFLKDLIMRCETYAHHFTVELFLPFILLNHENCDIHQWSYDAGYGDKWLALEYPLVLRSYERLYEGNMILWNEWKENSENAIHGTSLKILKAQEYAEKEQFLSVHLKKCGCVAITFVPPKFDSSKHIFKKMINAGTSIALWPRLCGKPLDEEVMEQIYRDLLSGCDFSMLPALILEKRKEAPEDKSSPINMLTLFWDNPYSLPPDLKAPLFAFPS